MIEYNNSILKQYRKNREYIRYREIKRDRENNKER